MTIYAEGELTTDEYTNRDGVKIPSTTIIVRKVKFLSKNPNMQDNQQSSQSAPRSQQQGPAPQNRPQQQAPAYRNSAPIYQEACRGGQQQRNGYTPQGNGNGYPAPPRYQQPKTDFLDIPDGVDDCPFN